uniref:Uncharacterized protein n=1 Tax=Arundo donax TaxID=35708 RepID=A0A0A8Z824_ARUDO
MILDCIHNITCFCLVFPRVHFIPVDNHHHTVFTLLLRSIRRIMFSRVSWSM